MVALALAAALLGIFVLTGLHGRAPASRRMLAALGITAAFSLLAWYARGVTISGALAGSSVAFILAVRAIRRFRLLPPVFSVTLAATRLGNRRKQQLRAAEAADGRSA